MENIYKLVAQSKKRLIPTIKEVVRKEIIKLLEVGTIYTIADTSWVSHVQMVPKKEGITMICNENNDLIPSRTVTGWKMCINYRKLNEYQEMTTFRFHL